MNVADYVLSKVSALGIDKAFVVYGAANGDLIDAFTRNDDIQYVACMHEQGAGFAAEGYAKVKGTPGCAIATSGPGGQNLLTSMANCFYDSVPCIFITGQIKREFMRPDPAIRQLGFQECDIVAMAAPVTKYAVTITKLEDVRFEIEKAIWIAMSGRPGPVLIDLPLDLQKEQIIPYQHTGFDILEDREYQVATNLPEIDAFCAKYLEDLKHAKRPCILVGGGVHTAKAVHHFRAVAKALMIPVYATWNAIDIATDEDFWCGGRVGTYGGKGRNFGIQNSDLLLIVGSRISGRITGGNPKSFARGAKKYLVEIDKALCNSDWQPVKTDENLNADVNMFLARMIYATKDGSPSHTQWVSDCRLLSHHYDPVNPEFCVRNDIVHPYAFLRLLSRLIPSNSIVVGDCGGNIVALMHAFETKPGQRVFSNNGNSPMGFSFAAAMGAWFADPSRPVYCIIGDGGMNMNIQELQTMKNYGVKVKTFIINNHIYGITKAYQKTNFHGRAEACGPKGYKPPNFIDIAEAYGAYTYVLEANKSSVDGGRWEEELRAALRFENDGPMVIDVECHDFHTYEPRIVGWQTPIEDLYPYLPREEFKANMQIETDPISENPPMPQVL